MRFLLWIKRCNFSSQVLTIGFMGGIGIKAEWVTGLKTIKAHAVNDCRAAPADGKEIAPPAGI